MEIKCLTQCLAHSLAHGAVNIIFFSDVEAREVKSGAKVTND